MTALMLGAKPLCEMAAPKFHAVYQTHLRGFDAFAEARMQNAVPASQLRKDPTRGQSLSPVAAR
jgi:hypothetical protein